MASCSFSSSSHGAPKEKKMKKKKYDVFVSFSGVDTRDNFTSHLHAALLRNKIQTFIDDRLERGHEISLALRMAIMGSKISVIIFSENYASSPWCLDELLQILDCKKNNGQFVIPVFYRIDPSHVRKQEGVYAGSFSKLEERFKNGMDKVFEWRTALTEAANLSGWDSRVTRPESKLVDAIVEDILNKLKSIFPIRNVKGTFGIEDHIAKMESLLCFRSPDVRVVGIWGMGGIGKTTLAAAVFNRISYQFESCCFLANVREEAEKCGLNHLRNKLLSELLEEENLDIGNPLVESTYVQYRLLHKKVFIVLDDVNNSSQLEFLAGDPDLFGLGSRIIVTARDMQVLRKVADEIYKVEGLNHHHALQLFLSKAFKENSITTDYMTLSKGVVDYAHGVPLALKVLGSFLHSKSKEEWESALKKLKTIPNMDILNILRISYDGLDESEKDIFLDIACFFKGNDKSFVERILDGCGFFASIGMRVLIDKCLITITGNKLGMHDLLQEMGWEIVRNQSIKESGNRSRLWNVEDIHHVLGRNTGTASIEGIFLDTSKSREVHVSPDVFSKMPVLRLLKIYSSDQERQCRVKFPLGLQALSDALRYLYWDGYPLECLPSNFSPESIIELKMPHSQLEKLWDGVQNLVRLREIDLSYSKNLIQLPDLSRTSNLECINLQYCTSLFEIPSCFQYLGKLSVLNLRCCYKIRDLPNLSRNIKELILEGTAIKEMPTPFASLDKLISLDLQNCKGLMNLPSCTSKLKSLKFLNLSGCTSIDMFPSLPRFISWLDLSGTTIKAVPSSIDLLSGLSRCHLKDCKRLESLPASICNLKSLKFLYLSGCSKLLCFPEILEPMECLRFLRLDGTAIKELPCSIENLIGLKELNLDMCQNLEVLPDSIHKLSGLENLLFFGCSNLEKFPPLPSSLRPTLIQDRNICQIRSQELMFFNCLRLDQKARRGILADAQIRVLHMATLSVKIEKEFKFYATPSIRICCPGNEIPKWFMYKTNGSSMSIQLPINWHDDNFLGLVLCTAVAFQDFSFGQRLKITCECSMRRNINEYHKFTWSVRGWEMDRDTKGFVNSDHIFLWYDHWMFQNFNAKQANYWSCFCNASFHFYPSDSRATIKKCGISLLYSQDAERFGIIGQGVRKPMVEITKTKRCREEFEASGSVTVISSDEEEEQDEPNHKRI